MDFLDTIRSRVRRETRLWMMRNNLSPWEFSEQIAGSAKISRSARWDAPKLVYRTVRGLIEGKASQANTVNLIREYLIEETGLDPRAIDVDPLLVRNAQANMRAFEKAQGRLSAETLRAYEGVYTISAIGGPYAFSIIVDFDTESGVLLVRCVLRDPDFAQFLHGFVTPAKHQFTVRLTSDEFGSDYSLTVSHREKHLPFDRPKNSGSHMLGEAVADVHVSVPIYEDGLTRAPSIEPPLWQRASGQDYRVEYKLRKCFTDHADRIDILRDGFNHASGLVQYATRPLNG